MSACPECGGPVVPRTTPGQPKKFCSRRCGRLGQGRRQNIKHAARHRRVAREWELANPIQAAYHKQGRTAKARGIGWEITYEEWLVWWGDDLPRRGKRRDDLCMCREGDAGPYRLDNIYKDTVSGNIAFARRNEANRLTKTI